MNHYIAVFFPASEGGYSVQFPDIPEVITQGCDLAEAMTMAQDALGAVLTDYVRAGEELPTPGCLREAMGWAEKERDESNCGIDQTREILYPIIPAPDFDDTPVKIMISVAKGRLTAIDAKARRAGLTRSRFLVRAAESYPA